jgi:hypothetical protein
MKRNLLALLFVISICALLQSCFYGNSNDENPNRYKPIIMERSVFENAIAVTAPKNVQKAGKIYIKDTYAFVNDENEGFHVYNYSNPENPVPISFIKIPGATDLSIRNNTFYVNQAVDLVTLTYNPLTNAISIKYRNRNAFPQKIAPNGQTVNVNDNQIIVKWILN